MGSPRRGSWAEEELKEKEFKAKINICYEIKII